MWRPSRVKICMFDALSELCFRAFIVDAPAVTVAPSAKSPDARDNVKLPAFPKQIYQDFVVSYRQNLIHLS